MSVKIGWSFTRPKERKSGRSAGGIYMFEMLKINKDNHGKHFVIGYLTYNREDLERFREKGYVVDVDVIGWLRFSPDVTPELVAATIARQRVVGWVSPRSRSARRSSSA